MKNERIIGLGIEAAACPNRCWHCFWDGPQGQNVLMDLSTVTVIAERVEEARHQHPPVADAFELLIYGDVTAHPQMGGLLDILERVNGSCRWLATNGAGLIEEANSASIDVLQQHGIRTLQLTFHGLKETHDRLVNRKGAYDDLIAVIHAAAERQLRLECLIMLNSLNASEVAALADTIRATEKGYERLSVEAHVPNPCGRAANCREIWLEDRQLDLVPRELLGDHQLKSESQWIAEIMSGTTGSKPEASTLRTEYWCLRVAHDLEVFHHLFEGRRWMHSAGNLGENTLGDVMDRLERNPDPALTYWKETDMRKLAEQYGDESVRSVFSRHGLRLKWMHDLLTDKLGP